MPAPKLRSRSRRRVYAKVPGGSTHIHYKKRMPAHAKCGKCGAALKGTPRELPFRMRKMAKTKKRPQRPYGGVLCTKCMRDLIVEKARQ